MTKVVRQQYQLREKIAVGGQADVWRTVEPRTGRQVVIKIMRPDPDEPDVNAQIQRFEREVRCQLSLHHSGIMTVMANGKMPDGLPFYVMPEAVRSLAAYVKPGGINEQEALYIMLTVIDAVDYAHSEGIYHRDLKPENVLFVDGRWVISDFGLCRDINSSSTTITQANKAYGSIAYMAPEQFDNAHQVAAPADVYSLGKVLIFCLTGRLPFPYARIDEAPAKFRYFLFKSLAENVEKRYQTVGEFRRDLELITRPTDYATVPLDTAKELLTAVLEGKPRAITRLARHLTAHADDEVFYKEFVPSLPPPALENLAASDPGAFAEIVNQFAKYADGQHPFSYTDRIADFFANVFSITTNPGLRRISLERILFVGQTHTRFYVRDVFVRIVVHFVDSEDILLVASLLRENPGAAEFVASELRKYSLPSSIKSALPLRTRWRITHKARRDAIQ